MAVFKEVNMYNPIRSLLSSQGFIVRGEVKDCDIAAVKDDVLWIVEMKLSANLTLIYQALDRKSASDWVFIAIPRPKNARDKNFRKLQKLLKLLDLGLIIVALDSPAQYAEILIYPKGKDNKSNKKSNLLRKEINGRTIDTIGGTTKKSVNTAYKERCIRILCLLEAKGNLTAKDLINTFGCDKDTSKILQNNFLKWFNRVSKGVYCISPIGKNYLEENKASSLIIYYRMKAET